MTFCGTRVARKLTRLNSEKPLKSLSFARSEESSRGDKTSIELFLRGVKTLASQRSVTGQVFAVILDSLCSE